MCPSSFGLLPPPCGGVFAFSFGCGCLPLLLVMAVLSPPPRFGGAVFTSPSFGVARSLLQKNVANLFRQIIPEQHALHHVKSGRKRGNTIQRRAVARVCTLPFFVAFQFFFGVGWLSPFEWCCLVLSSFGWCCFSLPSFGWCCSLLSPFGWWYGREMRRKGTFKKGKEKQRTRTHSFTRMENDIQREEKSLK